MKERREVKERESAKKAAQVTRFKNQFSYKVMATIICETLTSLSSLSLSLSHTASILMIFQNLSISKKKKFTIEAKETEEKREKFITKREKNLKEKHKL